TKLFFKKFVTLAQKLAFFLCFFAPAGTIAFNQHGCPVFMPIFKFACNWAVSKKSTLVLHKIIFCDLEF
ncbi:hypothetical protein, partial [Staphylococcus pettenkoferi]|uniref:hypothetical protein n=1 Tax=Staphylococcus pettenkoferi TaxID=170573 RepID=UPI001C931099